MHADIILGPSSYKGQIDKWISESDSYSLIFMVRLGGSIPSFDTSLAGDKTNSVNDNTAAPVVASEHSYMDSYWAVTDTGYTT